jgi:uncharacterized repeat protein (TIGR03803 family)
MLTFVFFSPSPSGLRPIFGLRNISLIHTEHQPDSKERKMNRATQDQRAFSSVAVRLFSLLVGSLLLACTVATAQTETVLYSFTGKADGADPYSTLLQDPQGNLYGTTYEGGATCFSGLTCGTVFEVSPTGTETVLHAFKPGIHDGYWPISGLIRDKAGALYGTTFNGGAGGAGAVFKITATGAVRLLYSFTQLGDGLYPKAELIRDAQGTFYGTTFYGGTGTACGSAGCGTVFKLTAAGTLTVLHSFSGAPDGQYPVAGLLLDAAGNLYGTTAGGGCSTIVAGCGVVFKIAPDGTETILYTFMGGADGGGPGALVRDEQGNLYGITSWAGYVGVGCGGGCGTVFKLTPSGEETVLHAFTGGRDGDAPLGRLVRDAKGNLYGATQQGGATGFNSPGTVFKVTPEGKESILYNFSAPGDGFNPVGGVIRDGQGNLYGTTLSGGAFGYGTVFKIVP